MVSVLVATVAQVLILAIIARALLSWFPGWRALTPVTVDDTVIRNADERVMRLVRRSRPSHCQGRAGRAPAVSALGHPAPWAGAEGGLLPMEKVTQTELVPVESSNMAAVGYDGGTLTVAFHGGRIYRYYGVSAEAYHGLIDAPARAATCTAASRAPTPSHGWRWTDVPA